MNMTELKIEKGVPMPPKRLSGLAACMQCMEIGDSLFVPGAADGAKRNAVTAVTSRLQRASGAKFTTRAVEGGLRVWRIA